jgi:hypothetical protein
VPSIWDFFFGSASTAIEKLRGQTIADNVTWLRTELNNGSNNTIRLYADVGGGAGQQAACVNLLNRIIDPANATVPGLAFTGAGKRADIVYDNTSPTTLRNLQRLLGFGNNSQGNYRGLEVHLLARSPQPPPAKVKFSFSGATDHNENLADVCNSDVHLRLQPFLYQKPEQIQYLANARPAVDLDEQPELGEESFTQRGFFVSAAADIDWQTYLAPNLPPLQRQRIEVLRYILSQQFPNGQKAFDVLFTYGIHTTTWRGGDTDPHPNAIGMPPTDQVVELALGVMATQVDYKGNAVPGALPAIIVNLDDFWYDDQYFGAQQQGDTFLYVNSLLGGGPTKRESVALHVNLLDPQNPVTNNDIQRTAKQIWDWRKAYLQKVGTTVSRQLIRFASTDDPTVAEITRQIQALLQSPKKNSRVLWVQLAPPFAPGLFNSLIKKSTLSPVFEGNNTANTALTFGTMYYHVARPGSTRILYPSTVLAEHPASSTVEALQNAANQVGKQLSDWPDSMLTSYASYPPELFAAPIRALRVEPNGEYFDYFRDIGAFFREPDNDKLNLAFAYLGQLMQRPVQNAGHRATQALEGDKPLDALYAAFKKYLNDGALALLPGALNDAGNIKALLAAMFLEGSGAKLALQNATLDPPPGDGGTDLDKVTIAGKLTVLGKDLDFTAVFTAPEEVISADVTITASVPSLTGLQWIPIETASLDFTIDEKLAIPSAKITCAVKWPGGDTLTLTIPLPTADGVLKLQGEFDKYQTLDTAFRMAGGTNMLARLPPPFSAANKFGLAEFEIGFDTKTEKLSQAVQFASFTARLQKGKQEEPKGPDKEKEKPDDTDQSTAEDKDQNNGKGQQVAQANGDDETIPLFGPISLSDFKIVLSVSDVGDLEKRRTSAALTGDFRIGAKGDPEAGIVQVGATLPELVFTGELSSGRILLKDLLATFKLDAVIPVSDKANIDAFAFSYDKPAGTASVSVDLNADLKIEPKGIKALKVEKVALLIEHGQETTGKLTGSFVLLEGTPTAVSLQLIAEYAGKEAGWTFSAKQTAGELKLLQFITTYLGAGYNFQPDLDLKDLEFVIQPKTKIYKFSGATAPLKIDFLGLIVSGTFELGQKPPDGSAKAAAPDAPDNAESSLMAMALPRRRPPSEHVTGRPLSSRGWAQLEARPRLPAPTLVMALEAQGGGEGESEPEPPAPVAYGHLTAQVQWRGVTLDVSYDFKKGEEAEQKVVVTLKSDDKEVACAIVEKTKDGTIATFSLGQDTLGGIIETFVGWATGQKYSLGAPWDLLNNIPLDAFKVTFNFTTREVTFAINIGPIQIGPARIDSIGLNYDKKKKVIVTLKGSFPWQTGADSDKLEWDAADPSATKTSPGSGNKYFDLRLLALGQHLALTYDKPLDRVGPLIDALRTLPMPDGKNVPVPLVSGNLKVDYLATAGWLVAADFGILKLEDDDPGGYCVQFSAVFNDPVLYAARLALAGKPAKLFAGLEFEIIYQQVSSTVGVWRSRIALPTYMRTFQAGAVTITLPIFSIDVYTNGDFAIDVGFPWNNDFSVSFTLEVMAGPLPVMGAGGFYFAKLSNATASRVPPGTSVPVTTKGEFNPIIAFGFGARIGLGKSVSMGILEAGFALTAFGIVQGVLAKWHPYPQSNSGGGGKGELQGQYYFQLTGSFGIIGRLYGSVDFVIVSARLDININIYVQISYTSYKPIVLSAVASVDVTLTISINLGLFSIDIHFSFSATVKATFTLNIGDTNAPWADGGAESRLLAPVEMRLFAMSGASLTMGTITPVWQGKLKETAPADREKLKALFTPALTATGEAVAAAKEQVACYVALLLMDGPAPSSPGTGQAASDGSSFERLCTLIAAWIGASVQLDPEPIPLPVVYDRTVGEAEIAAVLDTLNGKAAFPIPTDAIAAFLKDQVTMDVTVPDTSKKPDTVSSGVVFAVPPELHLNVANSADYAFGDFNVTVPGYLEALREQFKQLAVLVEEENKNALEARLEGFGPSVAAFLQGAWFAMLARQVANAMQQALRSYHYDATAKAGGTIQALLDDLNTQLGLSGTDVAIDAVHLFLANPQHKLQAGKGITVAGAPLIALDGENFAAVARRAFTPASGAYFDAKALGAANPDAPLNEGKPFTANSQQQTTQTSDTLEKIRARLGFPDIAALLNGSDIASDQSQVTIVSGAALQAPAFAYPTVDGDTLELLAGRFSIKVESFASTANVTGIQGLFSIDTSNPFLIVPHLPRAKVRALIDEALRTGAIRHASGLTSRFMLHGLRLDAKDKVVPQKPGLFITGTQGNYQYKVANTGLYVLTGQQFALPASPPAGFPITLTRTAAALPWMTLAGGDSLSYKVDATEAARIANLQGWIAKNVLDLNVTSIGVEPAMARIAASISVQSATPWISLGPVKLPRGDKVPAGTPLTLLQLPSELTGMQAETLTAAGLTGERVIARSVAPKFKLQTIRYDEATGDSTSQDIGAYAWASFISLTVRRLPPGSVTSPSAADSYELVGASTSDIILLERLLEALGTDDSKISGIALLYPSGAKAAPGLVSDDFSKTQFGLVKANLSTVTHPPTGVEASLAADAQDDAVWPKVLNASKIELLRFAWEASITRSGGFYLYYWDEGRKAGLPGQIFNDRGEALVSLLIGFPDASAVAGYVNCAALGEGLAGQHLAVVATALTPRESRQLDDTLEAVAFQAYLAPDAVAVAAADLPLSTSATVTVAGGLYQVVKLAADAQQPGNQLAAIATWFGTTPDAIKAQNPGVATKYPNWWSSGLPLLAAIQLPTVTLQPRPGRGTLREIARYYGTSEAQLGADNRSVTGLFSSSGPVNLTIGPMRTTPTESPGVVGYLATRTAVPDPDPKNPPPFDPQQFLTGLFTMLGYQVRQNQDFERVTALPAGPRTGSSSGKGKVRAAMADESGVWRYRLTIPSYRCLPDWTRKTPDNPYAGLDRVLQVDVNWQDIFGNRMLAKPEGLPIGPNCVNAIPSLTGYTDELIGIGQWPSMAAAWAVDKPGTITLHLTFNLSRYQIVAQVAADGTPSYADNAKHDLEHYKAIWLQLQDPNGVAFRLETSLSAGGTLDFADKPALLEWLTKIMDYLRAIAEGRTPGPLDGEKTFDVPLPDLNGAELLPVTVGFVLARDARLVAGAAHDVPGIARAVTPLAPAIDPKSQTSPGVAAQAVQSLAPTMREFAKRLEDALSTDGTAIKLAVGADRYAGRGGQALWLARIAKKDGGGIGFKLVPQPNANELAPLIYARRPLASALVSRARIPIWLFDGKKPLKFEGPPTQFSDFSNIDLETWAQNFANAFDLLLTPEYAAAALIVDARKGSSYLQRLRDAKELAAYAFSHLVVPAFKDDPKKPAGMGEAQEAFAQSLLEKLANAFATGAVVQFAAEVKAQIIEPTPPKATAVDPRLYGNISTKVTDQGATVTMTSAKLDLVDKAENLTSVLTASFDPDEVPPAFIDLSGRYRGSNIEHQIGALTGIRNYDASTWLSFPVPLQPPPPVHKSEVDGDLGLLAADLPAFKVPIIVRTYPSMPRMSKQAGDHKSGATTLEAARRWTYGATIVRDSYPPQDRFTFTVSFNHTIANSDALEATPLPDTFAGLAEFVSVYPGEKGLSAAIDKSLKPFGPGSSKEDLDAAEVVLASFVALAEFVSGALDRDYKADLGASMHAQAAAKYEFDLIDASAEATASPYLLKVRGAPPSGIAEPDLAIAGYKTARTKSGSDEWSFTFYLTDPKKLLSANDGRKLRDRTIVLRDMDILQRQDALTTLFIKRNVELVPGRPTADPFVFTTPEMSFTNPLRPSITEPGEIRIEMIGVPAKGPPTRQSLRKHLDVLFAALFANAPPQNTIQLTVRYAYDLGPAGLQRVELPVLMLPKTDFLLPGSDAAAAMPQKDMLDAIDAAVQKWFTADRPAGGGILEVVCVVLSNATGVPTPLLTLEDLTLHLEYIDPPLATSPPSGLALVAAE